MTAHTSNDSDLIVRRIPFEKVVTVVDNVDVAAPQLGQSGTFDDELYDSSGELVGTSKGSFRIEYERPVDGGLMTYYQEEIRFADGVVRAEGWADFNDVKAGKWVFYPAVGISGSYEGKSGYRQWRMTGVRQSAEAKIMLCE
jgi:hypothetical protein